jgi:ABC-2 type transport system permease protein
LYSGNFKLLSDRCFCRNAIFARTAGAKEKDERVLFIEKHLLQGNEPNVTITVNEKPFDVGVGPYNKMIDRVSNDNRKEVSID